MKMHCRCLFVIIFLLSSGAVHAAQLTVGDAVPAITAKDQFGKNFTFTNGVQFLLVATEMASAKAANQKLAELGAGFLETNQAVYLMDIHTMPGIASSWLKLRTC